MRVPDALLDLDGILHGGFNYVYRTTAYAPADGDHVIATSGTFAVTAFDPATNDKARIKVSNAGEGTTQLATAAGSLVGGPLLLSHGATATLYADAANNRWLVETNQKVDRPPLWSPTDGQNFTFDSNTYPAGWTEVIAAPNTYVKDGFWQIEGDGTWKYRKQASSVVNATGETMYVIGPVGFRKDLGFDHNYFVSVHPDNGGVPDETRYIQLYIQSRIVASEYYGFHTRLSFTAGIFGRGTYFMDNDTYSPPNFEWDSPFYIGLLLDAGQSSMAGISPYNNVDAMIKTDMVWSFAPATWGRPWFQIERTGNAAVKSSRFYIGGVDRQI